MKMLLGCLAALLVAGSAARADEMDRETKSIPGVASVATVTSNLAGSELDKESPDQSHGWRRGGWSVGYYGGWGGGYSVGYYGGGWRGSYYGGWHRPWSGYGYSVGYYPISYYRPYSVSYYGGCW